MSLLGSLLNSLSGSGTSKERPCANCPSDCALASAACAVCQPYKEQLIDTIYQVEHISELRARYVVTGGETVSGGTTTCPYCGAPSGDRFTCEYCGMQIAVDDGKIYVASASDIPNPILEAQDIIYARYEAVKGYSQSDSGLISGLLSALTGESGSTLGSKMTEDEIREAAGLYGVSVATYLTGLDNGKYLTLAGKKRADTVSSVGYSAAAVGASVLGGGYHRRPEPPRPSRPPQGGAHPQPPRPPQRPQTPPPSRPASSPSRPQSSRPSSPPSRPSFGTQSRPQSGSVRPSAQSKPQSSVKKPAQGVHKPGSGGGAGGRGRR